MKHISCLLQCFAALLLQLTPLGAQQFFFSAEQPSSCLSADGIITIVPTRGVPPFSYQWSNGATGVSIHGVAKGIYTATLTDATGATVVHSHILNSQELDLYLSDSKPSVFCNLASGALTIDVLAGQAPYTVSWSNGQSGLTAQGLTLGTYSVTVQDANGCTAQGEFVVKPPSAFYGPQADIDMVKEPDCINTAGGELSAILYGSGYTPYTYAWSNGATGMTATNLSAGTYTVTITDALGCTASGTYVLNRALNLTGSVVCNGSNTGTVSAQLQGATPPVAYSWSTGQTGPSLNNMAAGYYSVTAVDANGCSSSGAAVVNIPYLTVSDITQPCYAGNNGAAYCWVNSDAMANILWDDGTTDGANYTLSPGLHTVTVTTGLGCTLMGSVTIPPPVAPPLQISYTVTPADCTNGAGGALNVTLSGGVPPYTFYASGFNGFTANDPAALQNLKGDTYYLSANTKVGNKYCSAFTQTTLPDAGGFNPELVQSDLDCNTGFGSAAVLNVTAPGVQYNWSTGATTPDVHNLTAGCYSVTVSGQGSCLRFYEFCFYEDDSLQLGNQCGGLAMGALFNDLGISGCNGTAGIPYQMIRTLPSGALTFTDENGVYQAPLAQGNFDIRPASYDPADIACPPGGVYTVSATPGNTVSGLDFHFFNANPTDHRVKHRALRTAQPGYPYSLRFEVCNDGSNAVSGGLRLDHGNFLGSLNAVAFPQHAGIFSFASEVPGTPENSTSYVFPGIAPGSCELLQADFITPTSVSLNKEFITRATVTPSNGDPTPDNNVSTLHNTVVGAYDPNSVFAYPARNGNPRDGGKILRNTDRKITYQIVFQNTGNAPADLVIIRDTLDPALNIASVRNVTATHNMKVTVEGDNDVLVFKFPNISLPDSTSDYANSIGSVQYEIDLLPGLPVGTEINKQAAIYFDFNSPVITNNNVLEVVNNSTSVKSSGVQQTLSVFPNPAGEYFGFYAETEGQLTVFNSVGNTVLWQKVGAGLHRVPAAELPAGIYMVRLEAGGKNLVGRVMISH